MEGQTLLYHPSIGQREPSQAQVVDPERSFVLVTLLILIKLILTHDDYFCGMGEGMQSSTGMLSDGRNGGSLWSDQIVFLLVLALRRKKPSQAHMMHEARRRWTLIGSLPEMMMSSTG